MTYKHNRVNKPTEPGRWWVEGESVYAPIFNDGKAIINVWDRGDGDGLAFQWHRGEVFYTGPLPEPREEKA